jgi:ornithine cyclodeaminase/alanine dehydrogenase-like protein (mu-crystallin family)
MAAKDVDIILCMTNTNVPVIDGSWLEQGNTSFQSSAVISNCQERRHRRAAQRNR